MSAPVLSLKVLMAIFLVLIVLVAKDVGSAAAAVKLRRSTGSEQVNKNRLH